MEVDIFYKYFVYRNYVIINNFSTRRKNKNRKGGRRVFSEKDHTFVVCAYKENPMLEKTIKSLLKQSKYLFLK